MLKFWLWTWAIILTSLTILGQFSDLAGWSPFIQRLLLSIPAGSACGYAWFQLMYDK